jgi:hypothetical protein
MNFVTVKRALAAAGVLAVVLLAVGVEGYAQRGDRDLETVRGTVKRFTTAPKGEVDGAVLDDGTVIHWPPHLEERFKGIIEKGDRVEVSGRMETGPEGDTHLEVGTLTNLRTKASRTNEDVPPPPPAAGREPRGGPADLEKRLRGLEEKVDRLTEELRRLRREE